MGEPTIFGLGVCRMGMTRRQDLEAESYFYKVCGIIGLLVCLAGALLLGYQCVLLLRDGYWTEFPIRYFFDPPLQADWRNAQGVLKIWNGILDFPTWLAVASSSAALSCIMQKKLADTRDRQTTSHSRYSHQPDTRNDDMVRAPDCLQSAASVGMCVPTLGKTLAALAGRCPGNSA
jgi:hypothetical protein